MLVETTTCPGCGVRLERIEGAFDDRSMNVSPECRHLLGQVTGFELQHISLVGRCHQMTVDAYGAQHPGPPTRPIRVAYSLVGLHLALDLGFAGFEVREAHGRVGKPDPTWPGFERPPGLAEATIRDVAEAGVWAASIEGHAVGVQRWAEAVWQWWEGSRAEVESLTRRLLADWLERHGRSV